MDRSRRAAIGRALRAREQGPPDPAFLSLTEDEQENGLALFGAEEAGPLERQQAFDRAPANLETAARPDRVLKHARPPALPEPGNVLVWQVPVLAAMLTAVVAVFALWSATTSSDRPAERVEAARAVPDASAAASLTSSAVAALVLDEPVAGGEPIAIPAPAPSDDRPAPEARPAPDDVKPAVVRDAPRVRIDAPRPRMDVPVRATSVSVSRSIEPPPIPESTIAPSLATEARPVVAVAAAVPAAVPAAPARVESSAPVVRPPAPETLIQGVLSRYRNAYEDLDAGAARAVWPSVDHKALSKAFDRLEEQQLVFASCEIAVTDARAVASCRGVASYVPRVGNKDRRDDQREWEFKLSRADEGWLIDSVAAR